ncbi:MAG: nitroreductase [Dehalococcoidia bacterium]
MSEAIRTRRSIRGFKPEPVPVELIEGMLELAHLAPSATNCQPWEFIVLAGEPLDKAKRVNIEQADLGAPIQPDFKALPPNMLPGSYEQRQASLAEGLFATVGIERNDKAERKKWQLRGKRFFDAPAAILICLDEGIFNERHNISLVDVGIITQTIALAALEFGLGTCIQQDTIFYPDAIRAALDIPASKKFIVSVAIGYPDRELPANSFRSEREPVSSLVTWKI